MKKALKKLNDNIFIHLILFLPILIYRFLQRFIKISFPGFFYSLFYYYTFRIYKNNDLTIGIKELGKKKTIFPHPLGIVIGKSVKIGYNCTIYQNVTIGSKTVEAALRKEYPKIGNKVIIGASALIFGNIIIGNNVYIGAGTIVNKDIPDDSIVYGNPNIIKKI